MIIPIILAGGSGTRVWPVSNVEHPKQFLPLLNKKTLLQNTLQLINGVPSVASPIIICNAKHRIIAAAQAKEIDKSVTILLESSSHGTALAVLMSALYAAAQYDDPILLIQPSDSYIEDKDYYTALVQLSLPAATEGKIVTFGVITTEAHTGYGYIKSGAALLNMPGFVVDEFVEKPSLDVAQTYHLSGQYYWNCGIFLAKASTIIDEAKKYIPDLLKICKQSVSAAKIVDDFICVDTSSFDPLLDISFDHGIMQKTQKAVVFPFKSPWVDIGDWNRLWRITEKDEKNNVKKGQVIALDTENCYVHSHTRLIVTIGVKNLVIIETSDGLLVADINETQKIKDVINQLNKELKI